MYQTVESTSVENNLVMRGWERGVVDVKVGGLWTGLWAAAAQRGRQRESSSDGVRLLKAKATSGTLVPIPFRA
jgi:hypothetical protein